jgi:hypothetical protein
MPETYEEPIGRYRIICHEELPDRHKAEMRLNGIDPDDCWKLIWSFDDEEAAQRQLASCVEHAASFQTYRLKDAGPDAPKTITRSCWF